jgi:hypothetical protein
VSERRDDWFDEAWWQAQFDCLAIENPVLCNHRITLAHYELSCALHSVLGSDTGANFHTWAVWGSKKAGTTIRQQDLPRLRPAALTFGGGLGLAAALLSGRRRRWLLLGPGAGAAAGGALLYGLTDWLLDKATRLILAGNRIVLDDIGRVTARFVREFHDEVERDDERLEAFLGSLRAGPTAVGGQDLLRQAFRHYYAARHESDLDRKHEQMLFANLQAILHEHIRLQPYIGGAIPRPFRRFITARLLNFRAGLAELTVSRDVVAWQGIAYPPTLAKLDQPNLLAFLAGPGGWDRTPDSLVGSQAGDWTQIRERMNFIVDLFRSRHLDPTLFSAPYTPEQQIALLNGAVPAGLT